LAAKELARISKTDELAKAEIAYMDALDAALIQVEDEYRERGEKLPSEAQREARARQRIEAHLRKDYVEVKRKVELIEKWGRMREKALSGRQSELGFLKAEGAAPAGAQPQWSAQGRRAA
ncbi:MAG TPA: hypothetical protein VN803_15420, partial [Gemmatimonadales bacterium]|nr:hypothetical protein [Gemmatimonadales bacterium]